MFKRHLFALVATTMLGCHPASPPAPPPLPAAAFADIPGRDLTRFRVRDSGHRAALLDTLNAQERLWRHRRPARYDYAILRQCGCLGDLLYRPYIVRVDAGPSAAFDADGHLVTRDAARAAVLSIDSLFSDVRRHIESGAPYVQVSYDAQFGFPEHTLTDYPGITDSFSETTVRQFRPR